MSAFLPTRRRAEAFAAAVDAEADGRLSPAARMADRPADELVADRFADLLALVTDLRDIPSETPASPSAAFTGDLRERLMAAAETDLVPTDERLLLPGSGRHLEPVRRRRLAAVAVAAAVLAGTTGIATASASSVPGESLYPIKRGVEQAHQAIAVGDAARGRDELGQADARLDEVRAMLKGRGDATHLPDTLAAFSSAAGDGTSLLLRDYRTGGDVGSAEAVRDFTRSAMASLTDLTDQAPAGLQPMLTRASDVLVDADRRAADACGACRSRPPLAAAADLMPVSAASLDDLLGASDLARAAQAQAARGRAAATHQRSAGGGALHRADAGGRGGTDSGRDRDDGSKVNGSANDTGGSTGVVGRVVDGVVDGVTGSNGTHGGSSSRSHGSGGSGGSGTGGAVGSTPVKDPIGSILGDVTDGVGSTVGGVTKGVTGGH